MSASTADALDVDAIWNDVHQEREGEADGGAVVEHATKKPRMSNFKILLRGVDGLLFDHAVCSLLSEAYRLAQQRYNERRTPSASIAALSPAAYRLDVACTNACVVETVPVALYSASWADSAEDRERMLAAKHMFFQPLFVRVAGRLRILTVADSVKRTLHVCSPYCPFVLLQRDPSLVDLTDADDKLASSDFWHARQIKSEYLPSTVYRCATHNRFHVCSAFCDYVADNQSGVKLCPVSKRAVADEVQHSFGDGVGSAEQQAKSDEAKGVRGSGADDSEGKRNLRTIVNAHNRLYAAATIEVNGRRVRRGPGDRATSMRRKVSRAMRRTPEDQQPRRTTVASPSEVDACRPYNQKSKTAELPMTISAIAHRSFPERVAKDNHEFALDALHEMLHRVDRRTTFTFTDAVSRRVLFGNPTVFATCCERAAAIFYHLLFGLERRAKERARFEASHVQAERSVDQFVARCEANNTPVSLSQCIGHYEATMNAKTRRYPAVEFSAELYATLEAYYAVRATIFFFGLLSLPVRNATMMRADEIETIATAFGFESYCVVIYDLMHTGYGVRGVTNLARDNFVAERLFPSSSTLKQLGMLEKPVTNIKTIITSIFKAVEPNGVSPQYVLDTTLSWTRIVAISMEPNPARRVVEELLDKRDAQLYALRMVRPPSPDCESQ